MSLIRTNVCGKMKTQRCPSVLSSACPHWLLHYKDYDCVSLWTYYFLQTVTGTSLKQTSMVTSPSLYHVYAHHCVSHKFIHNLQFIFSVI